MGQRPLSWPRTRPDPPSLFHLLLVLSEFTVGGHGGQVLRCRVYRSVPVEAGHRQGQVWAGVWTLEGPGGWWGCCPSVGALRALCPGVCRAGLCPARCGRLEDRAGPLPSPLLTPGRRRLHSPVLFSFSAGPPPAPSRVSWCARGTLELPLPGGLCLLVGWWSGPWRSGPPSLLPVCVPCLPACRSLSCSSVKWTRAPALAGCRGRQSIVSP